MRGVRKAIGGGLLLAVAAAVMSAAEPPVADGTSGPSERWVDPSGVRGKVILGAAGGAEVGVEAFLKAADPDAPLLIVGPATNERQRMRLHRAAQRWRQRGMAQVEVVAITSRADAARPDAGQRLESAGAAWLATGRSRQLAELLVDTPTHQRLQELLARGGVVGAGGAAAATLGSAVVVRSSGGELTTCRGLSLLPDCVVVARRAPESRRRQIRHAAQAAPTCLVLELTDDSAILVGGRRLRPLGPQAIGVYLAEHGDHVAATRQSAAPLTLDYVALQRAARARARTPFPPSVLPAPVVEQGALLLVGGGGLPRAILERFIELAGGPEAPLVVLPTALPEPLPEQDGVAQLLRELGARRVTVLKGRSRDEVESDEFARIMSEARGVWFGGGRQWRFVDAYAATAAERLLRDVLTRGGVIGGSSAGASIQADYLVRGNPLGNEDMMALGYEQGLGLLPGTAVDQHFSERRRFDDLASVVVRYPQVLGIGIDEATALVVQGSVGSVLGQGAVHFCTPAPEQDGKVTVEYQTVRAGASYDLQQRKALDAPPAVP